MVGLWVRDCRLFFPHPSPPPCLSTALRATPVLKGEDMLRKGCTDQVAWHAMRPLHLVVAPSMVSFLAVCPASYERCGTIGFRCVYDAATPSEVVASCGADTLCGFAFPPYAFTELGNPLEALVPYVAAVAGGLYLPGATSLVRPSRNPPPPHDRFLIPLVFHRTVVHRLCVLLSTSQHCCFLGVGLCAVSIVGPAVLYSVSFRQDWAHWGTNGSATGVPDRMDSPVSLVSDATTACVAECIFQVPFGCLFTLSPVHMGM